MIRHALLVNLPQISEEIEVEYPPKSTVSLIQSFSCKHFRDSGKLITTDNLKVYLNGVELSPTQTLESLAISAGYFMEVLHDWAATDIMYMATCRLDATFVTFFFIIGWIAHKRNLCDSDFWDSNSFLSSLTNFFFKLTISLLLFHYFTLAICSFVPDFLCFLYVSCI